MKNISYIIVLLFLFTSCNKDKKLSKIEPIVKTTTQNIAKSEGYKLMETNCFVCHFPKPDPSKKGQMIAPPMLRVQEHYKPLYPKKEDFINAIKTWVANPTEDKVQMPGAVRKFNLMPKLVLTDDVINKIATTVYDTDFGASPKMHSKNEKLELNNGKKWQLDAKAIKTTKAIIEALSTFKLDKVNDYNDFGKKIFDNAKTLLLNKNNSDAKLAQLQVFFHNIEENMHQMIQVKTIKEGQEQQIILKKKFEKFLDFFE